MKQTPHPRRRALRLWLATLAGALATLLPGCAPRSKLLSGPITEELQRGTSSGTARFDHGAFDRLLRSHARFARGRVDYAGLASAGKPSSVPGVPAALLDYNRRLGEVDLTTLGRAEQLALLINAYNAFTLQLILERYPEISSIREIDDPWGQVRWKIGGHLHSLGEIEHGLLRPYFRDTRVHFAINCASLGCPPLRDEAFVAARLDQQLTDSAKATLGDERYARVRSGKLELSSILRWFERDFLDTAYVGGSGSIAAYVRPYVSAGVGGFIDAQGGRAKPGWIAYDWRLNDIER